MVDFIYNTPTKVVFGKNAEAQIGQLVKKQKCKKVLVHYGSGSVVRSGLLDRIYASLDAENIAYVSLGGVVPNPRLSKVYEGIELVKNEDVDFILAVGGGSTIDSAKAIAYGAVTEKDVWDFFTGAATVENALPVGAVLTIAAAGSEMSNSAVITNEDGWYKKGVNTEWGRCKFAIMNPELTYTLPPYQTASGAVDILMHTMERYFTSEPTMQITDIIAEGLMKTVMRNALISMQDPEDYDARAEVMWASSLSHNGLTGAGSLNGGDWASHKLEHELGGIFDVAHGAGLAALWGSWARYVYKENPFRFMQFAVNVLGVYADYNDIEGTALRGIEAMEDFYRSIDMPTSISEMDIDVTEDQIHEMAEKACNNGVIQLGTFKKLGLEDIKHIYTMAK